MLTFSPKKNNRIALCIGPTLDHDRVDYKKTMPFARSWKAVLFMSCFVIPMWYAEISVFQHAAETWSQADNFFMLIVSLFVTFWLIVWSFFTFLISVIYIPMISGRGVLLVCGGRLEIQIGVPWLSFAVREAAADVEDIFLVDPDPKSIFPKQGKQLQIVSKNSTKKKKKKKKRDSPIGSNMTEQDVFELKQAIELNRFKDAKLSDIDNSLSERKKVKETIHEVVKTNGIPLGDSNLEVADTNANSLLVLVLANILPILGVLFLDWKLDEIMILYWAETLIILFYHVLKNVVISPYAGLFSGVMTICSTGAFMALHLLFIWFSLSIVEEGDAVFTTSTYEVGQYFVTLWFGILALIISHGYSFVTHFLLNPNRQNRRKLLGNDEILSRVGVMHLTIILGMFLALMTGAPVWSLIVLVVLKLSADTNAHKKKHSGAQTSNIKASTFY